MPPTLNCHLYMGIQMSKYILSILIDLSLPSSLIFIMLPTHQHYTISNRKGHILNNLRQDKTRQDKTPLNTHKCYISITLTGLKFLVPKVISPEDVLSLLSMCFFFEAPSHSTSNFSIFFTCFILLYETYTISHS